MFYTYILRNSETNRYYVGYTKDLKKRLQLHQSGQVQSTKSNLNYKLEWYCAFKTQELALAFEKYLKTASGFAFRNKRLITKSLILSALP